MSLIEYETKLPKIALDSLPAVEKLFARVMVGVGECECLGNDIRKCESLAVCCFHPSLRLLIFISMYTKHNH